MIYTYIPLLSCRSLIRPAGFLGLLFGWAAFMSGRLTGSGPVGTYLHTYLGGGLLMRFQSN